MPSAQEIRAKALELQAKGVGGGDSTPASKRLFRPSGGQSSHGTEETFERLLQYTLYQSRAIDTLQAGAIIVFVFISETLQKTMADASALWDQSKPAQPAGGQEYKPHPLGEKRYLMFSTAVEAIMNLPWAQAPSVKDALKYFAEMDTETDMRPNIGQFNAPRFTQSWQGLGLGAIHYYLCL